MVCPVGSDLRQFVFSAVGKSFLVYLQFILSSVSRLLFLNFVAGLRFVFRLCGLVLVLLMMGYCFMLYFLLKLFDVLFQRFFLILVNGKFSLVLNVQSLKLFCCSLFVCVFLSLFFLSKVMLLFLRTEVSE